jgi:hypothetical protein
VHIAATQSPTGNSAVIPLALLYAVCMGPGRVEVRPALLHHRRRVAWATLIVPANTFGAPITLTKPLANDDRQKEKQHSAVQP